MSVKDYKNFVRASSNEPTTSNHNHYKPKLSGDEARRIYLEEIKDVNNTKPTINRDNKEQKSKRNNEDVSCKNIFVSAENDDIVTLRNTLDAFPDMLNAVDDYGWSLLMIACQANSVEAVKELLGRGIDISIRDKAGNSARSLVIKNKNLVLADLLLSHRKNEPEVSESGKEPNHEVKQSYDIDYNSLTQHTKRKRKKYFCEVCNAEYADKEDHLSSTIHNISASKDKKIPTNYVIPQTNKGYQIMIRVGWDRETGLGKDGSGNKYPIKAVEKKDRKGLGHDKKKHEEIKETVKTQNKRNFDRAKRKNRIFERDFRREFY